jgi:hypothetical protein
LQQFSVSFIVFFLAFVIMEEIMFSISVLRPFVRRREFFLGVSDGVGRSNFFRYGLSDLALPNQSWMTFVGRREEVFPRNIYPGCYIFGNGHSYSRLASDVDQAIQLIFPGILVLVFLLMLYNYSNGCAHARSLDTAAKIKNNGRTLVGIYKFMIWYLCLVYATAFEKVQDWVMKEE